VTGGADTGGSETCPKLAQETEIARRRYDRIAPIYDAIEWLMELRFRRWRREIWDLVDGVDVLELGVGTGKNLRFHPPSMEITAIDISERMLDRARRRAARLGSSARLQLADAQALPFDDASFDNVVATFLFCSVPDPVQGLREALRVLRPGGRLLLLEHVISEMPVLRTLMRWFDPIPFHIWGAHIDRDTVANVRAAGFAEVDSRDKSLDIVKLITARAPGR
jgi:ubiquinone/menaquinone biosynthesis C-methylase UbiE